jgi:uncharacterized membrane protein
MQKKFILTLVGIIIIAILIFSIGAYRILSRSDNNNDHVDNNGKNQDNQTYYTEFYVLDENGTTQNYPVDVKVNETCKIIIGIENHEKNITEYNVIMLLSKTNVNSDNLTIDALNIILSANETNQTLFTYQIYEAGEYKIVFQLIYYDHNNIEVIRNLHYWASVTDH